MKLAVGQRWYVVRTRPHAEAKAAFHLERQGFVTYLPRYLKRRRHARRVETVAAPLFPRYLFVAADLATQCWHAIHSTSASRNWYARRAPVPVADAILQHFGATTTPPALSGWMAPRFDGGDGEGADGVLSACLGLFEGMPDGERVAILIDLLGRKVRVVMDAEFVSGRANGAATRLKYCDGWPLVTRSAVACLKSTSGINAKLRADRRRGYVAPRHMKAIKDTGKT